MGTAIVVGAFYAGSRNINQGDALPGATTPAALALAPSSDVTPAKDALLERELQVQRLRASGADGRHMNATLSGAIRDWKALAHNDSLGVEISSPECHRAGCYFDVSQKDLATVSAFTLIVSHSAQFLSWNGAKLRTMPTRRLDGELEEAWFFAAPLEGQPLMLKSDTSAN